MGKTTLTVQTRHRIKSMIVDQELRAGDLLPAARVLAERLEVSNSVVREALAELVASGLISRGRGRQHAVARPTPDHVRELFEHTIHTDQVEPRELLEFRRGIEVISARLAAERRSGPDLDFLRAAHYRFEAAAASQEEDAFHDADTDFHRGVAVASHNKLIILVLDAMVDLLREVRRKSYRGHLAQGAGLDETVKDHSRILKAINAAHPEDAAASMDAHLRAVMRDLGLPD
jgi:GntR family transcriptional repressor for pyruvate dehydrogenase complex